MGGKNEFSNNYRLCGHICDYFAFNYVRLFRCKTDSKRSANGNEKS